jgi:uncharacterized protein (TIGR00290 family)
MKAPRTLLSWSSGKDAAWTLHTLRQSGAADVVALITTVNREFDRVAMHAVRREVLEMQAKAVGLPLVVVPLPWPCSNEAYELAMLSALQHARIRYEVSHVAFGDLFLEDVRIYREKQLERTGMQPLFPLWCLPTRVLAEGMIDGGLCAHLTCVDPRVLPASFAGRRFDHSLLAELPPGVDPCGENGEFHTCVTAGPMFSQPLDVTPGEVVDRVGFVFADLQLSHSNSGVEPPLFDAEGALSREFLLARGFCCGNRCRNCPYNWEAVPGSEIS